MIRGQIWLSVLAVSGLALNSAAADDVEPGSGACVDRAKVCSHTDVDFWWDNAVFDDLDLDTGWTPPNADVQVRFGLRVLGRTEVGLGGVVTSSWPAPVTVAATGRPDAGWLSIGYGIELIAQLKIDVEVLGTSYYWEGDIPLPGGIPNDLLMADDAVFDPFALPGLPPVTVADSIERIPVFTYDITGNVISIPGISGEFSVEAQTSLEARYTTERIEVANAAPIERFRGTTQVPASSPDGNYGDGLEFAAYPVGAIDYTGTITLYPHIEFSILGIDIIDADIFTLPLDIVRIDDEIAFEPADVHVALPDVSWEPSAVTVTSDSAAAVTVTNQGATRLELTAQQRPASLEVPLLVVVEPGETVTVPLRLADGVAETPLQETAIVAFATNDPDTPMIAIEATVSNLEPADDTAIGVASGCASGGGGSGGGVAVLLVLTLAALRRRFSSGNESTI